MPLLQNNNPLYLVVDNVRSLENIGSLFRSADAFGVEKIFLCGITATPALSSADRPTDKISKTALGAEKWIPWEYRKQTWRLVENLKKENITIVALEQTKNSIPIDKFVRKGPVALVVGNEVNGVSAAVLERADSIVHIPMTGKKESLNVAVAFGVAAYEFTKKKSPGLQLQTS